MDAQELWTRLELAKRRLDALHKVVAKDVRAIRGGESAIAEYVQTFHAFQTVVCHTADCITPRERQVLALIAAGKSSKLIAYELGISFRTAISHRYRLQTKLKAHNTADLTRAAMRMGLVEL